MANNQSAPAATGAPLDASILSSIVINGDLSKLSPNQKVEYYRQFCERLGLDPLSQPFKLLKLNGREILYCDRTGTQQLNKLHKVSHEIRAREMLSGCYVVTAQASTPDGRHTESIGAVTIDNLRGDSLCNAMMKAETKAKRRATLDLLGLGILDETETDFINNAQTAPAPIVASAPATSGAEDSAYGPTATGGPGITAEHMAKQKANKASQQAQAPQAPEQPKLSPFKQKYESIQEILDVLKNAADVKDVANLYYINAELVEASPEVKKEFSLKKDQFYSAGK